ncbi:MAG: hypothetical protein WC373_17545, partial [Smithella sp.]
MPDYIYIAVPTGEVRQVQEDEDYINNAGNITRWICSFPTGRKHSIVTIHKIEIPPGTHTLTVQLRGSGQTPPAVHINIPRPKQKIKKHIEGWVRLYMPGSTSAP